MIWILCPSFLLGVLYALYLFKKVCLKHFERLLSCCHPLPVLLFTFHTKSQPGCWTDSVAHQAAQNKIFLNCLDNFLEGYVYNIHYWTLFCWQRIHFTKQATWPKNVFYFIAHIQNIVLWGKCLAQAALTWPHQQPQKQQTDIIKDIWKYHGGKQLWKHNNEEKKLFLIDFFVFLAP